MKISASLLSFLYTAAATVQSSQAKAKEGPQFLHSRLSKQPETLNPTNNKVSLQSFSKDHQHVRRTQSSCQAEVNAVLNCGASQGCVQCTDAAFNGMFDDLNFLSCALAEDVMCNAINDDCAACSGCEAELVDFYECAASGCSTPWTCNDPNPCFQKQYDYYETCSNGCITCMNNEFTDVFDNPSVSCTLFENEMCQGLYEDCSACTAACEPVAEEYLECYATTNGCDGSGFSCAADDGPPFGTTQPPPPAGCPSGAIEVSVEESSVTRKACCASGNGSFVEGTGGEFSFSDCTPL